MIEELIPIENLLLNSSDFCISHSQEEAEYKKYDGYNFDLGTLKLK